MHQSKFLRDLFLKACVLREQGSASVESIHLCVTILQWLLTHWPASTNAWKMTPFPPVSKEATEGGTSLWTWEKAGREQRCWKPGCVMWAGHAQLSDCPCSALGEHEGSASQCARAEGHGHTQCSLQDSWRSLYTVCHYWNSPQHLRLNPAVEHSPFRNGHLASSVTAEVNKHPSCFRGSSYQWYTGSHT